MRFAILDATTNQMLQEHFPSDQPLPSNTKPKWLPRIRCNDCPGKLYTPGPGTTVENFEVHLKNRLHRVQVDKRTKGTLTPGS